MFYSIYSSFSILFAQIKIVRFNLMLESCCCIPFSCIRYINEEEISEQRDIILDIVFGLHTFNVCVRMLIDYNCAKNHSVQRAM